MNQQHFSVIANGNVFGKNKLNTSKNNRMVKHH